MRSAIKIVTLRDRAGDDERIGAVDVGGSMTDRDRHSARAKRLHRLRRADVRPRYRQAGPEEEEGDATHPGATDADEVHPAEVLGHGLREI